MPIVPISANIDGTTTNTSPGPEVGSIPNANNAGNIAIPASIAIDMSIIVITIAFFCKFSPFPI